MEVNCKYIKRKQLSKYLSAETLSYYKQGQSEETTNSSNNLKRKSTDTKPIDIIDVENDASTKKRKNDSEMDSNNGEVSFSSNFLLINTLLMQTNVLMWYLLFF